MVHQLLQIITPNGVSDAHELPVSYALAENVNVSVAAVSEKARVQLQLNTVPKINGHIFHPIWDVTNCSQRA